MKEVESLWGGELPEFENIEAANELIGALVMGLWSPLTRRQERGNPFRLTRLDVPATREGLAIFALMRRQAGEYHPPVGDTLLSPGRRWCAIGMLVVFALIATPVPFRPAL